MIEGKNLTVQDDPERFHRYRSHPRHHRAAVIIDPAVAQ